MSIEKEITQSQVTTLFYLQVSMTILWSLIFVGFVSKTSVNWFSIVLAILWAFTSFMYIKKHKKEPVSRYLTMRAIIVNAIGLTIVNLVIYYL
jgi:hypothetical protein